MGEPHQRTSASATTSPCSVVRSSSPPGQRSSSGPRGWTSTSISSPSRSSAPSARAIPPGAISMSPWSISWSMSPWSSEDTSQACVASRSRSVASSCWRSPSRSWCCSASRAAATSSPLRIVQRARGPGSCDHTRSAASPSEAGRVPATTRASADAGATAGVHDRRSSSRSTAARTPAPPGASTTYRWGRAVAARSSRALRPIGTPPRGGPTPRPPAGRPGRRTSPRPPRRRGRRRRPPRGT